MNIHRPIELRGGAVHNLKRIDLDLPARKFTVVCGVSGSGKSSLAIDTLYAEGQRRYIESFAPFVRQFVARLEKPAAERIDGIRPAVAIDASRPPGGGRATVGSAGEAIDHLRLLFAKVGRPFCPNCGLPIRRDSPQSVAEMLTATGEPRATPPTGGAERRVMPPTGGAERRVMPPTGGAERRVMVGFPAPLAAEDDWAERRAGWVRDGLLRLIVDGRTVAASDPLPPPRDPAGVFVVVDRLTLRDGVAGRLLDALELAFGRGAGRACVWLEGVPDEDLAESSPAPDDPRAGAVPVMVDERPWRLWTVGRALRCEPCDRELPDPEPKLFDPTDSHGACRTCEGRGHVPAIDLELVVPRPHLSIRGGAIEPWNAADHANHCQRLLEPALQACVRVDVPFAELTPSERDFIRLGSAEHDFLGIEPFFAALERDRPTAAVRTFCGRYRSPKPCQSCGGTGLREEARAFRLLAAGEVPQTFRPLAAGGGRLDLGDLGSLPIAELRSVLAAVADGWSPHEHRLGDELLGRILHRLDYLIEVGLSYLTLDRPLDTLSTGEARRTALTKALGSSLVDMLYVLDEPCTGLHASDVRRLLGSVERLCRRGNTVVAVEHDEAFIAAADHVVEIGPGAGDHGGKVVFEGPPDRLPLTPGSPTGDCLARRRGGPRSRPRRPVKHGRLKLTDARGHNLQHLDVEFPLDLLCVVTGVSGAGKSTLVEDTLYPILARHFRQEGTKPLPYGDLTGQGQIQDCVLVDRTPVGRSPRSNPATYVKAFDEIRTVFAQTPEAKLRNQGVGHFSFNSAEGRCGDCEGDGCLRIDMQFLPDVFVTCPTCKGTRYRDEVLGVTVRDRNIAEVLEQTVREAFGFFRGHPKVLTKLKPLLDVGLDYLRLGQPVHTLSGGESQRLKLAGHLASARKSRTLFILDEPTAGLHPTDVVQLLDCLDGLTAVGHSLLVIEHDLQLIAAADWIIDLGPGPAADGGRIVVAGPPEAVAACPDSLTGRHLQEFLRRGSGAG